MGLALAIAALSLLALPGCGGCRRDPADAQTDEEKLAEEERRRLEQEKPKPPLQALRLRTRPAVPPPPSRGNRRDPSDNDRRNSPDRLCKPGHWTSVTLTEAKANHEDFRGELETSTIDNRLNPVSLDGQPYHLTIARSVTLPKGQTRHFESAVYLPLGVARPYALWRLTGPHGGMAHLENSIVLDVMPSYQYHFVVLARLPGSYSYLESLRSVRVGSDMEGTAPYYRVHLLGGGAASDRVLLPSHSLFWTSTACLLWDDLEPARLDADQKQALLDWLHWGGLLIVSGPDTLDTLRGSFLDDYLPAESTGSVELSSGDLQALQYWNVGGPPPLMARPWGGVKLQLRDGVQARFVPQCGQLLAEGRVGRGRVVVSAFRLRGSELIAWPGYDGFVNACLLGRPPRDYKEWQGERVVHWAETPEPHRLDAALISRLRYFTRDTYPANLATPMSQYGADAMHDVSGLDRPLDQQASPGMAAWNDSSAVADQAREALSYASRIKIPDGRFILWVIGSYLLVLVPLNWIVFRAIGRVEWAWAAAPLIAIICTVVVIRAAQLDIGFVRARTEIGVLEIQGSLPRAHLTRYAALYTSLTTAYQFDMEDAGGVMQPFPAAQSTAPSSPAALRIERGEKVEMSGLSVDSSSLKYVHGEQMLDLAGPLELIENDEGGLGLVNQTDLRLQGAALLHKEADGKIKAQWLGTLEPGSQTAVVWSWSSMVDEDAVDEDVAAEKSPAADKVSPFTAKRDDNRLTSLAVAPGELSIRGLIALAEDHRLMSPGEIRLVAWSDEELPGMTIRPAAPQSRFGTVVVAHLRYGFDREPKADVRLDPDRSKMTRTDD